MEKKQTNFISPVTLSQMLGVSKQTIDNYRKKCGLPYYKLGNTIRFKWTEVDKWLKERQIQAHG